jgi:hypothetical protein
VHEDSVKEDICHASKFESQQEKKKKKIFVVVACGGVSRVGEVKKKNDSW